MYRWEERHTPTSLLFYICLSLNFFPPYFFKCFSVCHINSFTQSLTSFIPARLATCGALSVSLAICHSILCCQNIQVLSMSFCRCLPRCERVRSEPKHLSPWRLREHQRLLHLPLSAGILCQKGIHGLHRCTHTHTYIPRWEVWASVCPYLHWVLRQFIHAYSSSRSTFLAITYLFIVYHIWRPRTESKLLWLVKSSKKLWCH